ncbi:MAG: hypothetical protein ACXIU8_04795 [Alkalilacustris sp.]
MLEWVGWCNNRRRLEPIGNGPPSDAEVNVCAALKAGHMAAQPSQPSPCLLENGYSVSAGGIQ